MVKLWNFKDQFTYNDVLFLWCKIDWLNDINI